MTVTFAPTPSHLVQTISSIEQSRRKKFPPARDLSAPRLGGWKSVPAIVAFEPAWKKKTTAEGLAAVSSQLSGKRKYIRKDDFSAVSSWLTSLGLRYLNEDAAQPTQALTLDEIKNYEMPDQWLFDHVYARALDVLPDSYHHDLVTQVESCVAVALEVWSPEFLNKLSAAGRKGGKISKRSKVFTHADLARVAGKSKSIQAEELGCSVATISRLRREAAAVSDKPLS